MDSLEELNFKIQETKEILKTLERNKSEILNNNKLTWKKFFQDNFDWTKDYRAILSIYYYNDDKTGFMISLMDGPEFPFTQDLSFEIKDDAFLLIKTGFQTPLKGIITVQDVETINTFIMKSSFKEVLFSDNFERMLKEFDSIRAAIASFKIVKLSKARYSEKEKDYGSDING